MQFYPNERIALFIDGSNLYSRRSRASASTSTFKRLREEFAAQGRLIRAFYYTALVDDLEYSPIRPLIDWLDYNGYAMVTKPTKEFTDASGRRKIKGNMDIELAIDVLEMAEHVDHIVLFSGDGDFRCLVDAAQRRGVRVSVVSTVRSQPPMVADELRRQADCFIELDDLKERIWRDLPARAADRGGHDAGHGRNRRHGVVAGTRPRHGRRTGRRRTAPCARAWSSFAPPTARRSPAGTTPPWPSFGPASGGGRGAPAGGGAGAGPARRQPHRPSLHRRSCRHAPLPHPPRARALPADRTPPRPTTASSWSPAAFTNAVRCVPAAQPAARRRNRRLSPLPRRGDRSPCRISRRFWRSAASPTTRCSPASAASRSRHAFAHGAVHELAPRPAMIDSYHCSRYNVNTGRLSAAMFDAVVGAHPRTARPRGRAPRPLRADQARRCGATLAASGPRALRYRWSRSRRALRRFQSFSFSLARLS